jgi:hypothetical protein
MTRAMPKAVVIRGGESDASPPLENHAGMRNYAELCVTRREIPRDKSRTVDGTRNESAGTKSAAMYPSQYRNGSSLLPVRRVC